MFLANLAFLYFSEERRRKSEIERFREFVKASKSKDVVEYESVLPGEGDLPEQPQDELIDLDQVGAEELLNAK